MSIRGLSLILAAVAAFTAATLASADQQAVTQVRFIDACTNEITGVTTPKGKAKLRIELEGLAPNANLYMDVVVAPADVPDETNHMHEDHIVKRVTIGPDARYAFEKRMSFAKGHSIFKVRVNWAQPAGVGKSGAGGTSIYVLREKHQRFYELKGTSVCAWETPWAVTSERYVNDSSTALTTISRHLMMDELQEREKGIDLGLMPDGDSGLPIIAATGTIFGKQVINKHIKNPLVGSIIAENHGWIFHENSETRQKMQTRSILQTWSLAPRQGGYFASKLSFRRFPVLEYALEREGLSCAKWKVSRVGYMDAGFPVESFFTVPDDISGDAARSQQFIEAFVPSVNNCKEMTGVNSGDPGYQITGGQNGPLFFYPQE